MSNPKKNIALDYGRIPPQDLDSESALLGSMLLDRSIIDTVLSGVKPEYFYKEAHQLIYEAMQTVAAKGDEIDYITVSDILRTKDKLDQVGGVTYLMELTKGVSTGYNLGYWMPSIIESYMRREYIRVANEAIEVSFDESTDLADVMSRINTSFGSIEETFAGVQKSRRLREVAEVCVNDYHERKKLREDGKIIGVATGLNELNLMTGGWQNGDSILLAGRTSMGKTAMSLHFAMAAFNEGKKVQFFSYEMTAERLVDRILISQTMVSPDAFKYGNLLQSDEQELESALDYLGRSGFFIDDNSYMNIDQLFAKCRIAKKKGECDIVLIDYIGLIPPSERKNVREQEVSDISKKIKKYAKELNVPVITLVQINRGAEASAGKRPKLSELRESGSLEQDADVVLMVYRPEYYGINSIEIPSPEGSGVMQEDSANMGILIVGKQRNGKTGDVLFKHSHGLNVIKDFRSDDDRPF